MIREARPLRPVATGGDDVPGHGASRTAVAAAVLRAAHQILDREPRILDDPVSPGLLPESTPEAIAAASARLELGFMRVLRASFVARSRIAEDALGRAAADGARQYVILGAGFDTFAHRQPSWARDIEIYELDHPASQRAKTSALERRGLPEPPNLHFCPIDFERESLGSALESSGFEREARTVFAWLGVVPYLTLDAIDSTLRQITESATVSSLIASYVVPSSWLVGADAEAVSISSTAAAQRGEPWLSRFAPHEMEARLRGLGYGRIEHLGPAEYAALFFEGRTDGLPTPCFERVVLASAGAHG